MSPQMSKISTVGIRKFVVHAQNTQTFWQYQEYECYCNDVRKVIFVTKTSFSHFFGTPCKALTSSSGKKHLQFSLPSQLCQMVLLNIKGTAGRIARPQQTRIALDQLRIENVLFLSQLVKLRCLHTCVLAEKLDSRKVS